MIHDQVIEYTSSEKPYYKAYRNKSLENKPIVVTLGGSDGGDNFCSEMAFELSRYGFTSIAIPYHKFKGLPQNIDKIPLEYIQQAWNDALKGMFGLESYISRPIVVLGRSRGAELALLLGSYFNKEVKGVVAYSPTSVVWGTSDNLRSSWLIKGKELPFAPIDSEAWNQAIEYQDGNDGISLVECFIRSKNLMGVEIEIPVENISGPVLLLSGKNDLLWPSSMFADLVEERLTKHGFMYDCINIQYPKVGHCFDIPNRPLEDDDFQFQFGKMTFNLGGQPKATVLAENDSWMKVMHFLNSYCDLD